MFTFNSIFRSLICIVAMVFSEKLHAQITPVPVPPSPPVPVNTVYVDDVGTNGSGVRTNPFNSIQHAINYLKSCPGDSRIYVLPGTYVENLTIDNFTHALELSSTGTATNTIIDGNQNGSVINVNGNVKLIHIEGFTIKNGKNTASSSYPERYGSGGGIRCEDSIINIKDNIIIYNEALYGGGIGCFLNNLYPLKPDVRNNIISANTSIKDGGGVSLFRMDYDFVIDNNIISDVEGYSGGNASLSGNGGGIFVFGYHLMSGFITNNSLDKNSSAAGGGVYILGKGDYSVYGNVICENATSNYSGGGIYYETNYHPNNFDLQDYSIKMIDNTIYSNTGNGIVVNGGCHSVMRDNRISYNNANDNNGGGINLVGKEGSGYGYDMIEYNLIHRNTAKDGGGVYNNNLVKHGSDPYSNATRIRSNMIYRNTATQNGGGLNFARNGMVCDQGYICNNTVAYNSADVNGGGVYSGENVDVDPYNFIIWDNTAGVSGPDCYLHPNWGVLFCVNCTISDLNWNEGNLTGKKINHNDPMFMSVVDDNFRIHPNSFSVDAGEMDEAELPANDFEHNSRIIAVKSTVPIVDIGADEALPTQGQ